MKTSIDHLPEDKQTQLRAIAELFRECLAVDKLILFGSYARGEQVEDRETGYLSDFDLCVVVDTEKQAADVALCRAVRRADGGNAEYFDAAFFGMLQSDDRTHQHRFAGARTANDAQYLPHTDVEVELIVDDLRAKGIAQSAHLYRNVVMRVPVVGMGKGRLRHHQSQPIPVKNTAKKASSTMTRKIPCTTASVVRRPTSSAFALTCMPW